MKYKKLYSILAASLFLSVSLSQTCSAANPIVQTLYTTDPAPMVYGDTCYVYTGHDEDGAEYYDMRDWRCYSTQDMVNWTDHGSPLSLATFSWAKSDAWAGQVIERNGKFYYYVPVIAKTGGNSIGVAVSDSPTGPFKDALGHPLCQGYGFIDPTVFIDTDGQAYLYFGNPNLHYVKLNKDMISYSGSINKVNLTPQGFGARPNNKDRATLYEEGPWIYKRGNLYYLVFSAGGIPEYISYSTSTSPTGPWTYRGVIMPTEGKSFTNHSGIVDYKGNSYFFYHNGALPGGSGFARSVAVEQFNYNSDGSIPTIKMSTTGPKAVGNLNPYKQTEAETICQESGVKTEACGEGGMNVSFIENGDWIRVQGVNFASGAKSFEARVATPYGGGNIELRLDSPTGKLIGTCPVTTTGNWQKYVTKTCTVSGASGIHDLYFKFTGGGGSLFNFNWWKFTPVNASDADQSTKPSNPTTPNKVVPGETVKLQDGWYYIKNVHANKYLQVADNLGKAGQNVELRTGNGSEGQKWYLKNLDNGYITLESGLGKFMIDVSYGKDEDGANIGIYDGYSGEAQQLVLKPSSTKDAYIIATKCSGITKVLDGYEFGKDDGTNIVQWSYGGKGNQQFIFEPVTQTPSAKPEVKPEPPQVSSKLKLDYTVSNWGSSYQVDFNITNNTSADVSTWTLKIKKSDINITTSWNINVNESGDYYVITPVSWNSTISKGRMVSFGIQGSGSLGNNLSYTLA